MNYQTITIEKNKNERDREKLINYEEILKKLRYSKNFEKISSIIESTLLIALWLGILGLTTGIIFIFINALIASYIATASIIVMIGSFLGIATNIFQKK